MPYLDIYTPLSAEIKKCVAEGTKTLRKGHYHNGSHTETQYMCTKLKTVSLHKYPPRNSPDIKENLSIAILNSGVVVYMRCGRDIFWGQTDNTN